MTTTFRGSANSVCPSGEYTRDTNGVITCKGTNDVDYAKLAIEVCAAPAAIILLSLLCWVWCTCCPRYVPKRCRVEDEESTSVVAPQASSDRNHIVASPPASRPSAGHGTSHDKTSSARPEPGKTVTFSEAV